MTRTFEGVERRSFLKTLAAGGVLLLVGPTAVRVLSAEDRDVLGAAEPFTPVAWVRLAEDGTVTIVCHRSEMGQGIRTCMAMIIADEMDADWAKVRVEQAEGDEKRYGSQNTDGSTSIRNFLPRYREAGATVRALLEDAAAAEWGVPASEVRADLHRVVHAPSGRALAFGALVARARTTSAPAKERLRLKRRDEYRIVGKEIPIVDLDDIVTGRAKYAADVTRPGMRFAVITRPPVHGAKVVSVDDAAAKRVPGVERIVRLPEAAPPSGFAALGGVAVIARNTWAAMKGREALRVTWSDAPNASYDSTAYAAAMERTAREPGKVVRDQGDVAVALAGAAKRVEAEYHVAHLAHVPMEPPAALAEPTKEGGIEVWACTQSPGGARAEVARALGIDAAKVRINVTLLGGGFGRKSKPDFVVEAARLAKEVGAPVRVQWTREDDVANGYLHTVAQQRLEGALDAEGRVTGWLHRTVLPSISSTFTPNVTHASASELGQGATDLPFAIPNVRVENGAATAHTRIGWYRSVINIPHGFAVSSFVDEMAHAAGKDPKEFLLALLGPDRVVDMGAAGLAAKPWNYGATFDDHPLDIARYRRVVELAASNAGWGTKLPPGEGRGIAVHRSFLSYVAAVIHVAIAKDGSITIPRADVAIDAGYTTNPDRVRAQMEGGLIMGLSNALHGAITFRGGRVVQRNFNDYRVLRLKEAPRTIAVHVVDGEGKPGGVGEPGVPPIAPAFCNAIFAATGKRIRRLPIGDQLRPRAAD